MKGVHHLWRTFYNYFIVYWIVLWTLLYYLYFFNWYALPNFCTKISLAYGVRISCDPWMKLRVLELFPWSWLTHLWMVVSFPWNNLFVCPWLSATDTPEGLRVIHSIVASPPNSGTENRGALWIQVGIITIPDKIVDTSPLPPFKRWPTLSSGRNSLVGLLIAEPTLNRGEGGENKIVLGLSGGNTMCMTDDISKNGQN